MLRTNFEIENTMILFPFVILICQNKFFKVFYRQTVCSVCTLECNPWLGGQCETNAHSYATAHPTKPMGKLCTQQTHCYGKNSPHISTHSSRMLQWPSLERMSARGTGCLSEGEVCLLGWCLCTRGVSACQGVSAPQRGECLPGGSKSIVMVE